MADPIWCTRSHGEYEFCNCPDPVKSRDVEREIERISIQREIPHWKWDDNQVCFIFVECSKCHLVRSA